MYRAIVSINANSLNQLFRAMFECGLFNNFFSENKRLIVAIDQQLLL